MASSSCGPLIPDRSVVSTDPPGAWLAVAVICSIGLYIAESGVNPAVGDPLDALWWGVVTLTTVGYGDVFPVTPEGRLAAAGLMILGITLFAAIHGDDHEPAHRAGPGGFG